MTQKNYGTCWVAQYAAFSQFIGNRENLAWCNERFRTTLVPEQVAPDGRLPLELARTKPSSYSLFDMDVLSLVAQIASTRDQNLARFATPDGRGLASLPDRQPALLFAGLSYRNPEYIAFWKRLDGDPTVPEMIRNFPVRQPLLWVCQPS